MFASYSSLFKKYWPMLSFGLLTVFWGNFGQSFFISWYGASIQQQLGLSATGYGSAYSGATLISGLSIMALGGLIDKIKIHYFVMFAGAGLFVAALSMWQVSTFPMLIVTFFLLRFFGQGLLPHTSGTAMAKYFSLNRGKALSVASSGVPLGEVILPSVAVVLIGLLGWQNTWLMISATIPLVFLPLALWLLKHSGPAESSVHPEKSRHKEIVDGSRRTLLADYRFWFALPLVLMPPFVVTGIFIHQGFILQQKQWSPGLFALSFTIYGLIHWVASIIAGALVDHFSATKILSYLGLPFAAGLLVSGFLNGNWVSFYLMAAMGCGIGMMGPVVGSLWAEVYGTKNLGSIRSLITSITILSTAVSPVLLGYLIDSGLEANHLLISLGLYAIAGVVMSRFSYHR